MRTFRLKRDQFERAKEEAKHKADISVQIINEKRFIEKIGDYAFAVEMEDDFEQITIFEVMEV